MTTIYIFSFFKMFLVIMPFFVPFLQSLGLSMSQVMQTQSVFALTIAAVEIPTGYFADRFGRRVSLIAGSFLYGICFSSLLLINSFFGIICYEIAIGVAMGFVNGADVALLYDNLRVKDQNTTSKAFANLQLSTVLGESTAAIMAGLIISHGLRSILLVQAVVGWLPLLCILKLKFADQHPRQHHLSNTQSNLKNLKAFCASLSSTNKVGMRLLAAQVVAGLSSFMVVWLLQKYWELSEVPLTWFGFLWAALNLTSGLSGKLTQLIRETLGTRFVLICIVLLPITSYIMLALKPGVVGVIFCFGFYISRGLTQVLLRQMYNTHIPHEFRATANSLPSFLFRGSFAILGPLAGWSVDQFGMPASLIIIALAFVALLPVMLPIIWRPESYQ